MSSAMTDDEIRAFLREGSRTGKLATVRPNGAPHVTPVWFDLDEDTGDLVFLTRTDSVKARNMAVEPRVSVSVDLETMPFAFARVDGIAHLTPFEEDPDATRQWATATARRYVGDDRAEQYGRRNGVPGEAVVRVTPTRLVGSAGVAD